MFAFQTRDSRVELTRPGCAQWADLVAQLTAKYPNAAARIFVDILNEPDSFQLQWQAQADAGLPGAGDLYLAAMDAVYPVNNGETLFSRPKEGVR